MSSARPMQKTTRGMRKWLSVRMHFTVVLKVIGFLQIRAMDWRQHTENAFALSTRPVCIGPFGRLRKPAQWGIRYHNFRDDFVPDPVSVEQRRCARCRVESCAGRVCAGAFGEPEAGRRGLSRGCRRACA